MKAKELQQDASLAASVKWQPQLSFSFHYLREGRLDQSNRYSKRNRVYQGRKGVRYADEVQSEIKYGIDVHKKLSTLRLDRERQLVDHHRSDEREVLKNIETSITTK